MTDPHHLTTGEPTAELAGGGALGTGSVSATGSAAIARATTRPAQGPRIGRTTATVRPAVDPVLRVQSHLTARDHTILSWLGDHGVLTTAQVAFALFPTADVAQRRLRLLTDLGLIQRFRPLRLDGGSYPYHYVLDHLGALVLAAQSGTDAPRPAQSRNRMQALTRRPDLGHLLGVNQFFTDLAGYARTRPGAALHRWWPTARCLGYGAFADDPRNPEQTSYRAVIRPDAHGVFTDHRAQHPGCSETATVPFLLEYDTGTEPLAVLTGKLDGYDRLARQTGHHWPVLFWLHSSTRERHLHERLAPTLRGTVPVATAARDRAIGHNPADAIWWLDTDAGSPWKRLVELPATPFTGDLPTDLHRNDGEVTR